MKAYSNLQPYSGCCRDSQKFLNLAVASTSFACVEKQKHSHKQQTVLTLTITGCLFF